MEQKQISKKENISLDEYTTFKKEDGATKITYVSKDGAVELQVSSMRYLTFALAKGRLAKTAMDMFEQIGIQCEEMKDEKTRKLIFVNEELKLKFFLAKASDVPTYVEYGAADIGIVGKDTILEEDRKLYEVLDLGFGKCRMCVCGPESARDLLKNHGMIRVASKYPRIAKDYFNNKKGQTVEVNAPAGVIKYEIKKITK